MPVTEKMFSFATSLTVQAYADPAQRITMLADLAGMSEYWQVSARIDTLKALVAKQSKPAHEQAVPGWYVIDGDTIQVKKGKQTGYSYVVKNGAYLGTKGEGAEILKKIVADGKTYAVEYAKVTGKCGVCNTKLTDPKSIEAGIGPVCKAKFAL